MQIMISIELWNGINNIFHCAKYKKKRCKKKMIQFDCRSSAAAIYEITEQVSFHFSAVGIDEIY